MEIPVKIYEKLGQFKYPNRKSHNLTDIQTIIWNKTDELKFVYCGQLKSDKKVLDGTCMVVFDNGSIFEGYYVNNLKEGPGRFIWPNGDYYIGEWSESKRNGKGEMHYFNGDVFKGKFRNDNMHGVGYWQYAKKDSDEESDEDPNEAQKPKLVKKKYDNGKEIELEKNDSKSKHLEKYVISKKEQSSCCIIF